MQRISLRHLSDQVLLRDLAMHTKNDRHTTALLLAHIAEVRRRKLYRGAGYPSMYLYLVHELLMSTDVALKRNQAAWAARKLPAILPAIEDGRLNLTGVVLLAPHLTRDNAEALLAAATHKTTRAIRQLIAERFPQADLRTVIQPIAPTIAASPATATVGLQLRDTPARSLELVSKPVEPAALSESAKAMEPLAAPPMPMVAKVAPLSPQRFGVQFTMDQSTHDMLRDVQALLGPSVPSGDIAGVFALALECLKARLEKTKFGKCEHPRTQRGSKNARYVPSEVKRMVWERDGGRCSFIGAGGKRCDARESLDFDHVIPVARGGEATVANIRLCCREHNQYEAERVLGAGFMLAKREAAQARSKSAGSRESSQALVHRLRELGLSVDEAARAAARCTNYPGMPFEERLTLALRGFAPARVCIVPHAPSSPA
jgi:5-methylcytosine-specific restriction endonuclease McrA